MYSKEFMRYLIKYQDTQKTKKEEKNIKYFKFGAKDRLLATVLLTSR